ncbi:PEP/pyruvate-binding domain-containing protein [Thermodesulforhabdus norvegica]|uniref:Phosphoenolpyruvate synthase n=1 Tax=Thermodesulforhabdus norvegica TaxID=39841 RepID=A0A1I4SH64_9BACT|nr:PEP/pyruvate-binding domain-containing protein [Thermodesulforhabdus norvegica]SFM63825.1 phosphoenolpyruvate synthase [Thermodesulforhabdus norvegica]
MRIFRYLSRKGKKRAFQREKLRQKLRERYSDFLELLSSNVELADIISDISETLRTGKIVGMNYVRSRATLAVSHALRMIRALNRMSGNRYASLYEVFDSLKNSIEKEISLAPPSLPRTIVFPLSHVDLTMGDWVGGKSAHLGEIASRAKLPVPEGFAVSVKAFHIFFEKNDLKAEISKLKQLTDFNDTAATQNLSEQIQALILRSPVPDEVKDALLAAFDGLARRKKAEDFSVAVRSSAVGEDTERSFAGQYVSLLNVSREKLVDAYKIVVASLYTPRALAYRFYSGIPDEDVTMGVLCLEMIDSVAAGVIYTADPTSPSSNQIIISAVWGLGPYAVEGRVQPDRYVVDRSRPLKIAEIRVSEKPVQLVRNPSGGLRETAVSPEKITAPCLREDQIITLAEYGLRLESHFGCPQDAEWALDPEGRLLILQSRPLQYVEREKDGRDEVVEVKGLEPIISGGETACPGAGAGRVFIIRDEEDLDKFPEGGILVARHSSPQFVVLMNKASAIVCEYGSTTGHMASVAREFGIPTLLGVPGAMERLKEGMEVTVDATGRRIFAGTIRELLRNRDRRKATVPGTPVHNILARVAQYIVPLNLTSPRDPSFSPHNCRTIHDIMRYVHEKSYEEMFTIGDALSDEIRFALRVKASLPIDLYIIDLGGGLAKEDLFLEKDSVEIEEIVNPPLRALLSGMTDEKVRQKEPRPVDLRGFLSVMTEQMLSPPKLGAERFGDRSYAMISDKYLNFNSRVGYHYSLLDAYCGKTVHKNYVSFSFMGGAADDLRRHRRAECIGIILKELGFSVEVKGDRVTGRIVKYEAPYLLECLRQIGLMLEYTRQMDMLMSTDKSAEFFARRFLEQNYRLDDLC